MRNIFSHRILAVVQVACACIALTFVQAAEARYYLPQTTKVPVQRLAENMGRQLEQDPKNTGLRRNLARVYAMAYALDSDTAETISQREGEKDDGNLQPWFGPQPPMVYRIEPNRDTKRHARSRDYLARALKHYALVLKASPDDLIARMGYGWCLEQSGDKAAAIPQYRKVIELAWAHDRTSPGGFTAFATEEAADYLLPLLDKEKDKAEIAMLTERVAQLQKKGRPITPLVIPLGSGTTARDVEDRSASVNFDADGSGIPKRWSWIARDAGWLVYDPGRTGQIKSGLQFFGSVTFWLFWQNGYQALAALDNDGNGALSGKELEGLAIWHDRNGNGISEPGEVTALQEAGVASLSVRHEQDLRHPDRIRYSPQGVRYKDGSTRPSYDIILQPR